MKANDLRSITVLLANGDMTEWRQRYGDYRRESEKNLKAANVTARGGGTNQHAITEGR